jgi:hypothetical protein
MYEKISRADLEQLFYTSVIRYDGIPVYIRATAENGLVQAKEIAAEKDSVWLRITDDKFDFTPVPLGFCNIEGKALLLSRRPSRHFQVGLTSRTLVMSWVNGESDRRAEEAMKSMQHKGLRDCILNKFPSMEEALQKLKDKEHSTIAISRSFALDRDHRIYFRKNAIGLYDKESKQPVFFGTKSYMKTLWEE